MFGVMGTSAAMAQAACAHKQEEFIGLLFECSVADPTIYQLSCAGEITIESVKNGAKVTETYADLSDTQTSIQADANTQIKIKGDVTKFTFAKPWEEGYMSVVSINTTHCKNLSILDLRFQSGLTALDLSSNTALTDLYCGGCTGLTALDLSSNTALTDLYCNDCTGLTSISYPATNSDISTAIANAITGATAADGTVYTDSEGAYYSTIADAATAKGWTIEQL